MMLQDTGINFVWA